MRHPSAVSIVIGALAWSAAFAGAQDSVRGPVRARSTYEDLQMFSQVLNQIRVNHPDSIDTHELLMAAIEGMVRAADPHSYVIPRLRLDPAKEAQFRDGKLMPVPIEFVFIGGAPVVAGVAAGTDAARLDILPGDELLAIDKRPVSARSADELDIGLAGSKNSEVTLTFERRRDDGSLVRLERRVRRERYGEATSVPAVKMLDATTGYIRITTFMGEKVADELHDALQQLEQRGMQRLVLDLRDNGGGSVAEAAHVAGEFLPKGAVVYTSAGRKADVADTGRVQRSFWRSERRYPIVVMINAGTASASELVAGALQDHDRALIFGRPSFGKSLLMRGFPLADGSLIILVIGHVRTPCGRVLQRQYRNVSVREYYRLARADRDTAGRPSCKTSGGRIVYGGGGIYPDLVVDGAGATPRWLANIGEQSLPLTWAGGYVSANSAALTTLDAFVQAPSLGPTTLADFRTFAQRQGIEIPIDSTADAMLRRVLVRSVAYAKWGTPGAYRVDARLDPEVAAAARSIERASAILRAP